jgi:hypothetical protein
MDFRWRGLTWWSGFHLASQAGDVVSQLADVHDGARSACTGRPIQCVPAIRIAATLVNGISSTSSTWGAPDRTPVVYQLDGQHPAQVQGMCYR